MMEEIPNNQSEYKEKEKLSYIRVLIFFSIVGLIVTALVTISKEGNYSANIHIPSKNSEGDSVILVRNPFDHLSLEARSVIVFDVNNKEVLFEYNSEAQLPLASLTKLMTVLVASELLPNEYTLTIDEESLTEEGDSGLFANEKWKISDLLDFILVVSSNDGADVVAGIAGAVRMNESHELGNSPEATFIQAMNEKSKQINLSQTYFVNETGLDSSTAVSGGYGSAKDIALLMEYILREQPALVSATTYENLEFTSESNLIHTATNTNKIIGNIPGLIASKTGFTDLAGGNLVIAYNVGLNKPMIAAVLGSTQEGRFTDMIQLVEASLEYLSQ